MKLWLLLLLLLVTIPTAEAVYIQDPLLTQSSTRAGQITIGAGNYSSVGVSESHTILNDTVFLNASANMTISNVSIASSLTNTTFSVTATTGTLNISVQMLTSNNVYYLIVDGIQTSTNDTSDAGGFANFTYSDWTQNTHTFRVFQPNLQSPAAGSTVNGVYPPIQTAVTLSWEDGIYNQDRVLVSADAGFNIIEADQFATSDSVSAVLTSGLHYWKVRSYNSSTSTYGADSEVRNFTINAVTTSLTGTNIQGVAYELDDDTYLPQDGAAVYISNSTWSSQAVTGSNGYFLFSGLANGTLYSLFAKKTNYKDSSTELVTTDNGSTTTKNIQLYKCDSGFDCFYNQKHVDFYVSNPLGTEYTGVTVAIYKGSDVTATDTGLTGDDGGFTSLLLIGQQYRVTFVSTAQGVNEEITITIRPKGQDDSYTIYIWGFPTTNRADNITWNLSTSINNATSTWLNLSYTSDTATTIGHFWVKNETGTILYSETANTFTTWNTGYAVNDTSGLQYVWGFNATHPTWGYIDPSKSIQFRSGYLIDLKVSDTRYYTWFSVAFLIGLALSFSRTTNRNGYILIPLFALFFWSVGWFPAGYQPHHFGVIFAALILGMLAYLRTAEKKAAYPY